MALSLAVTASFSGCALVPPLLPPLPTHSEVSGQHPRGWLDMLPRLPQPLAPAAVAPKGLCHPEMLPPHRHPLPLRTACIADRHSGDLTQVDEDPPPEGQEWPFGLLLRPLPHPPGAHR